MKFIIDLTECKMPQWWGKSWPRKIEVVTGQHSSEFDMVPESIEPAVYQDMKDTILRRDTGIEYLPEALLIPIGFDSRNMPEGAVVLPA